MRSVRALAVLIATVGATGCASLAPEYQRPPAPVPQKWSVDEQVASTADAAAALPAVADFQQQHWRDYFTDSRLQTLIERALQHNRDLRIASLNVERVRALYQIQSAESLPTLNLSGGQNLQRNRVDGQGANTSRRYDASVGLASYELDFFGRVRSLKDQALAKYLASEDAAKSARNTLIAEVARAWFAWAANYELDVLARETLASRQQSLDLEHKRFEVGAVSALDLAQSRTAHARAREDAARQKSALAAAHNALAVLVGTPVENDLLPNAISEGFAALPDWGGDLQADVLLARPDIAAAEKQLMAANANIGAARAAFFPRISLTASTGLVSNELEDLFSGDQRGWSFAPRINVPIFSGGRLRAGLQAAKIDRDIALAQYEKAIQNAFREVADALSDRMTLAERMAAAQALLDAAREAEELSDARYESGLDSHLTLLDAQRMRYSAEQGWINTRLADAGNRIMLYKLLGGGWQAQAQNDSEGEAQ